MEITGEVTNRFSPTLDVEQPILYQAAATHLLKTGSNVKHLKRIEATHPMTISGDRCYGHIPARGAIS